MDFFCTITCGTDGTAPPAAIEGSCASGNDPGAVGGLDWRNLPRTSSHGCLVLLFSGQLVGMPQPVTGTPCRVCRQGNLNFIGRRRGAGCVPAAVRHWHGVDQTTGPNPRKSKIRAAVDRRNLPALETNQAKKNVVPRSPNLGGTATRTTSTAHESRN